MRSVPIEHSTKAWAIGESWQVGQQCAMFDQRTLKVHVYLCVRTHYSSPDTVPIHQGNSAYWQYVGRG
ncbi:hypothetical protein CPB85DRAFT_1433485 [Mucidula mucida]|nr:hypothetical protein CPB85DRAFT_1433485 [Mucidula mucida]